MFRKGFILGLIVAATCAGMVLIMQPSAANNPVHKARINLGRHLFYDTRLSYNQTKTCVSCHEPSLAFTDGYRTSSGADGYNVKHNSPSLLNVKYRSVYTWSNPAIKSLKAQLQFPFLNEHPRELGWKGNEQIILKRFSSNSLYQQLFKKAFPLQINPYQLENLQTAIIAFEEQLVAFQSPFDLYLKGNHSALNEAAKAGLALFKSSRLSCVNCHQWEPAFKQVISVFSGGIRVPSLRNVMLTAPYMHDGKIEDINGVLAYYDHKKSLLLTKQEKYQLIAFLTALTDTSYLSNKELLNPFQY